MDRLWPDWLDVSRETFEKLAMFEAEVLRWNGAINLVSKASQTEIWQRHILDSAQIFFAVPATNRLWLDMGSGGGFPGLVMAIMGVPNMVLAESDQRKAAFLREASRKLEVPATVVAKRLGDLPPQNAGTISARALTSLTGLLAYANTHLAKDGRAVFPKGRQLQLELNEATADWAFDHHILPSQTDPDAAMLVVENITKR